MPTIVHSEEKNIQNKPQKTNKDQKSSQNSVMNIILLFPVKKQPYWTTKDSQPNLTSSQIFQLDGQQASGG